MRAAAGMSDAGILSDAESRVTDWVQSQQRQQQRGGKDLDPLAVMQMLEVDRLRLKLGQLLQEGTFGRVYQVKKHAH
jgi:phage-related baseplate assembly protein